MDIAIVGRHTKISDDMREKIEAKLAKIGELAPRATRAEVHVVHERNPRLSSDAERVEITLHNRGVVRVEASADDRLVALEQAAARMLERLRRLHERKAHRHQTKAPLHAVVNNELAEVTPIESKPVPVESVEAWEGAPDDYTREVPLDGSPIAIRSKTHTAVPMTASEAIDQMELVGHDFYLFLDSDSGMPSAVYRRRGWTYGVIQLDTSDHATEGDEERESA